MPGEWVGGPGTGRRAGFAFVGRGGELRALTDTLRDGPAVVLVEGEAGVGKSRLLREAAARLDGEGLVVLRGWCHPLREPLPFGPVVDALRDAHALFGPGTDLSPATAALHPYLPELTGRLPERTEEPGAGPQQQLMRAVQDLLGSLGPVVLMVEDLHWADDATRDLLLLLARNPPKGLRLVLTYRAHDLSGARNVLGVPYRRPVGVGGTEITLTPLTEEQVRELAASAIGPAAAARLGRKLFERSGGLPLAAEEDLLVLADRVQDGAFTGVSSLLEEAGVPRALQEAVNSRVAVLDPGAVAVVEAAAVLAVPTSEEQLALLAGLEDEQAEEALTAALLADVLVERGPGRYGFRHVLARQAVYERIPGPRRRRLHVRAIEALTGRQTPALVQIAHHTRRLGDVTAWLPTARAAADHAVAVGDDGVAAELLQQLLAEAALPSGERARTALELSRIAMYRADSSTSTAILGRIIADPALPTVVRGEIRFNLSRALVDSSADRSHSVAQMQQAITELADRPGLAAVAMSALSMVSGRGSRISTTAEDQALMAEAVRTVARSEDPLARATVLTNRITLMGMTGDARAGELLAELPRSSPDRAVQRECARALYNAAYGAMLRGNDRARALHDEAEEAARRTGYQVIEQGCAVIRLRLDLAEGQWSGLDDRLAAVLPQTAEGTKFRIAALMVRAALEVARGYWAAARQNLATFTTTDEENASWDVGQAGVTLLGRIDLLEGDPEAAWERLRRPLAARRHKGVWVRAHDLTPTAVQAALACGLSAEAERLTDEAATGIEGRDAPAAAAEVLWCRGMTTAATDPLAALAHLTRAQARYEALGRLHTAARVAEQAGCLRLAHDPDEAGHHLRQALDVFTRLGATADAARCRQALRETGVRSPDPGRRHSYGPELSPRERQVAELLATGAGNQAIARVLGLSTRTAEHHVANTLKKLGLRRDQVRDATGAGGCT
ncbi:LuxR family transcriptional regulator [Kitasatospora herbaricolor]|uniref:ATP-binding protein n=1 Tax=Kitasatospora herbaricolor TaxID=68217 RepID=UPI0017499F2E|nr:LuxR family transcriptional regulator [Kitasatospora herbaricolor]MDQ0312460.1 DNA-binding CsgD family transcriptional regulator [Kitasatospora herbaricolor]GGV40901.1 LuxR family transcriptional regulator [Kitasatospora herbaricolor]